MGVVREVVSPSTGAQSFAASEPQSRASPVPLVSVTERVQPSPYGTVTSARGPFRGSVQRAHTVSAPSAAPFPAEALVMDPNLAPAAQISLAMARTTGERGLEHIQAALRDAERACMRTQSLGQTDAIVEASQLYYRPPRRPWWPAPQACLPVAVMQTPPPLPPGGLDGRISALEAKRRQTEVRAQEDFYQREEEYQLKIRELESMMDLRKQDGQNEVEQLRFDLAEAQRKSESYYNELITVRNELTEYKANWYTEPTTVSVDTGRVAQLEAEVLEWKSRFSQIQESSSWEYDRVVAEVNTLKTELAQKTELIYQLEQKVSSAGDLQDENERLRKMVRELERAEADLRESVQEYKMRGDLLEKEMETLKAELAQQAEMLRNAEESRRELISLREDNEHLRRVCEQLERAEADLRQSVLEYKTRGDLLEKEIETLKAEKDFLQAKGTVQNDISSTRNLSTRIGELTQSSNMASFRRESPRVSIQREVVMNLVDGYGESDSAQMHMADLTADMDY